MSRSDKLFSQLFPAAARAFNTDLSATTLWNDQADPEAIDRLWYAALCADVLLIRAMSYRETFDLFSRPKFWGDLYAFSQCMRGDAGMAAKGQRKQADRAEWKGFLDRRMSEDELAACDAWKPKPTEVFVLVDEMMAADFRLTLSYNKRTGLASCTVIDDSPSRKSGGWAISTADENGAAALKAAVYKHVTLLQGDWISLLEQPVKRGRG